MEHYLIYLRKSRSDALAEDPAAVLARHEAQLLQLARAQSLPIGAVYREVASGESIAARPLMARLLQEVRAGLWTGVMVVEVERLARGDTREQGIVQQAFFYSGTKIITPAKTFDPANEFDMEFFEFGLFMSRREYKTITRRMNLGRKASQKEGKFVGSKPPFGYETVKLSGEKGFTLRPVPEQAQTVRRIFELYVHHGLGPSRIAKELNNLGLPNASGRPWAHHSVITVLKNPVYTGVIASGRRQTTRRILPDGTVTRTSPLASPDLFPGRHEAIIPPEWFEQAVKRAKSRAVPPAPSGVQNPLRGLVTCGNCGGNMQRKRWNGTPFLVCPNPDCRNAGADFSLVEQRVLEALSILLNDVLIHPCEEDFSNGATKELERALHHQMKEQVLLESQQSNLHDLLERGIYDQACFFQRQETLTKKLENNRTRQQRLEALLVELRAESLEVPETPLPLPDLYSKAAEYAGAGQANELLRQYMAKIVYTRERGGRWQQRDNFSLDLHLIL